jgi:hypothetical protein
MTSEQINSEISHIVSIITHPAGYDIGNCGLICIRRYEYPVWAVEIESSTVENQPRIDVKEFDDPLAAATFFVKKRNELKIGMEYENGKI